MTPAEWEATGLSLLVATAATVLAAPFALATGVALARGDGWWRRPLEAAVMTPLVLPPVVTGFLLLALFGPHGPIGGLVAPLGLNLAFTTFAAILASAVVGFPLFVRAVRQAVEAVDPRLEQAARTLGATRWHALLTITLPLARPGTLSGGLLAFARSLGEFGATIVFAGNIEGVSQTLPLAIFSAMQSPGGEAVAVRMVGLSMVLAVGSLVASEWVARRAVTT